MNWIRSLIIFAFMLSAGTSAKAEPEESASHRLILPLVISGEFGRERESRITLSNASATPITVKTRYRGMTGTPLAHVNVGEIICNDTPLQPQAWAAQNLRDLCPALRTTDLENIGYLLLEAKGDQRGRIYATQVTSNAQSGAQFGLDAEPLGAHDIAAPSIAAAGLYLPPTPTSLPRPFMQLGPLSVLGISGSVGMPGTRAQCWFAAPDGAKNLQLSLHDETDNIIGAAVALSLSTGEMARIDPLTAAGLTQGTYQNLRVYISDASTSFPNINGEALVAGCGSENDAKLIQYQRARSADPADATRQRTAYADHATSTTPAYATFAGLSNTAVNPSDPSTKIAHAFYVQPEDFLRCRVMHLDGRFAAWARFLELQVKDAAGTVVAGGNRIKDTGVFSSGLRERAGGALAGPWTIEVSIDEDAVALDRSGLPRTGYGVWGVMCESAAGISQMMIFGESRTTPLEDDF
jgi:hypothetical protein